MEARNRSDLVPNCARLEQNRTNQGFFSLSFTKAFFFYIFFKSRCHPDYLKTNLIKTKAIFHNTWDVINKIKVGLFNAVVSLDFITVACTLSQRRGEFRT